MYDYENKETYMIIVVLKPHIRYYKNDFLSIFKMQTTQIQIKPITNDKEFTEANELIELLLECQEGSKEEKVLEVVTILASEYEKKFYAISKPNTLIAY
jgi:hypothetical protein